MKNLFNIEKNIYLMFLTSFGWSMLFSIGLVKRFLCAEYFPMTIILTLGIAACCFGISWLFIYKPNCNYTWHVVSLYLFLIFCLKYPLFTYDGQMFSEMGADFFTNALSNTFIDYMKIFEGGLYFSSIERTISWIVIRVFGARKYAPQLMSLIMTALISFTGGYFSSNKFSRYGSEFFRFAIIAIALIGHPNDWMFCFLAVPYMFILFLVELYLIDFDELKLWQYVVFMIFTAFIMTSKFYYVLWIPMAIILLVFSWKRGWRFRIYNFVVISAGLFECIYSYSRQASAGADVAKVNFPGLYAFVNTVVYNWVQTYVTVLGVTGNAFNANYMILIVIILMTGYFMYNIYRDYHRVASCLGFFSQVFIIGEYCMAFLTDTFGFCASIYDWSITSPSVPVWYAYWTNIAAIIAMIICAYLIASNLSNEKYRYTLIPIVIFLVALNGNVHRQYDYTIFGKWSDYADYSDRKQITIPTYDGWNVDINANEMDITLEAVCTGFDMNGIDEYIGQGITTVYINRTANTMDSHYFMVVYDAEGNEICKKAAVSESAPYVVGFVLDEACFDISRIEFYDENDNPLEIGNWTRLGYVL